MKVSIIIRTLNEQRYLPELLSAIKAQRFDNDQYEIVLVDSGSTDGTLAIADACGCKIVHIDKHQSTFGRSLNKGCEAAKGKVLVFISGHCIPTDRDWLKNLIDPIVRKRAEYVYGKQIGRDATKFSERMHFAQYFPDASSIPQEGYFCNNANAALSKNIWKRFKFDESLTGLEDMHLAKNLCKAGLRIAYQAKANVYHIHNETWRQVRMRYKREAIALQYIAPEMTLSVLDAIKLFCRDVVFDIREAQRQHVLGRNMIEIVLFRFNQYYGTYLGGLPQLDEPEYDCSDVSTH